MLNVQSKKIHSISVVIGIVLLFGWQYYSEYNNMEKSDSEWWRHAVIYQIYPRSFQDSNQDGIGDLKGIESRLDYLVDLGVDAVWICPIFKSPMKDLGYDISNYTDIDPMFGTIQDFRDLVSAMHKRGLRLIHDFVPNHTSNQHDWFKKSIKKLEPYTDYYVWKDPKGFQDDGTPIPPNNWVSRFRLTAWTYNEVRKQFYYHLYTPEQPDLNYRNKAVVEEMEKVLKFWIDEGIDGFRFDAARGLLEDAEFRDEPLSGMSDNPNDYEYTKHIYTWDLPETRNLLTYFYRTIKDYSQDRCLCILQTCYDEGNFKCGDLPLNMGFFRPLPTALEVKSIIDNTLAKTPNEKVSNWVLGSHDVWRAGSRFGEELIDAFNALSLILPGISVTYYGEEIGMKNNMDITFEDTVDPKGKNAGPEKYHATSKGSRDPERTPMQWSSEPNAGFSPKGVTPWLPLHKNYKTLNVHNQLKNSHSHLSVYKDLLKLGKAEPLLLYGNTSVVVSGDVVSIIRHIKGSVAKIILVANLSRVEHTVNISDILRQVDMYKNADQTLLILLDTFSEKHRIDSDKIELKPGQAIILKM